MFSILQKLYSNRQTKHLRTNMQLLKKQKNQELDYTTTVGGIR